MTKPQQRKWICPKCGHGHLAPSKPRLMDPRRYCLPCSAKEKTVFVERFCPAREKEKEKRKGEREEKKKLLKEKKKQELNTKWTVQGYYLRPPLLKLCKAEDLNSFQIRKSKTKTYSTGTLLPGTLYKGSRLKAIITLGTEAADAIYTLIWAIYQGSQTQINKGFIKLFDFAINPRFNSQAFHQEALKELIKFFPPPSPSLINLDRERLQKLAAEGEEEARNALLRMDSRRNNKG